MLFEQDENGLLLKCTFIGIIIIIAVVASDTSTWQSLMDHLDVMCLDGERAHCVYVLTSVCII